MILFAAFVIALLASVVVLYTLPLLGVVDPTVIGTIAASMTGGVLSSENRSISTSRL